MSELNSTLISLAELKEQIENVIVLDQRHQLSDPDWGAAQYAQGHVPGAAFIHLDTDLSASPNGQNGRHPLPDREEFSRKVAQWGIDGTRQVVVYDQDNGAFAARLWWMINKWLGLECVAVLNGGFAAWVAAGYPVEAGAAASAPTGSADISGKITQDTSSLVAMADVRKNLDQPKFTIVDARGTDRYLGKTEPMDAVAGHIPNALNRPFADNLQADGTMKPPEVLRDEWQTLLGGRDPSAVVHQCGSGVTGCHNMLAMEHAGLAGSRLYGGSWSEWSSHPENPMVRGPASSNPEQA